MFRVEVEVTAVAVGESLVCVGGSVGNKVLRVAFRGRNLLMAHRCQRSRTWMHKKAVMRLGWKTLSLERWREGTRAVGPGAWSQRALRRAQLSCGSTKSEGRNVCRGSRSHVTIVTRLLTRSVGSGCVSVGKRVAIAQSRTEAWVKSNGEQWRAKARMRAAGCEISTQASGLGGVDG